MIAQARVGKRSRKGVCARPRISPRSAADVAARKRPASALRGPGPHGSARKTCSTKPARKLSKKQALQARMRRDTKTLRLTLSGRPSDVKITADMDEGTKLRSHRFGECSPDAGPNTAAMAGATSRWQEQNEGSRRAGAATA